MALCSQTEMAVELERIRAIAERVATSNSLELVDLEFHGGGKGRILRIFIDKPGGVTHQDCADVSREVGTILDVEDVVPGATYTLEVSSPGLDRRLVKPADYERFQGSLVKLVTNEPVDGSRNFVGRLVEFQDGRLILEIKGKKKDPPSRVTLELANVAKANLVPEF
jgi:ribosome maturation factor RimP